MVVVDAGRHDDAFEISNASITPSPVTFQAVLTSELSANSRSLSMCRNELSWNPSKFQNRLKVACGRTCCNHEMPPGRVMNEKPESRLRNPLSGAGTRPPG